MFAGHNCYEAGDGHKAGERKVEHAQLEYRGGGAQFNCIRICEMEKFDAHVARQI